ncbi:GRAB protein, partial [Amia calva]|nr:GRAB protein [Amia calva]
MASLYILAIIITVTSALAGGSGVEIIGGKEVPPHSRPYMAYILLGRGKSSSCGGFLIREDFVLTAAHCQAQSYTVILGAHNIMENEKAQMITQVEKAIPHCGYEEYHNDIMLLKLKKKVPLNKNVAVIPLPLEQKSVSPNTECSVAGWGATDPSGKGSSNTLVEVNVTVWDFTHCKQEWGREYTKTNICAGDPKHGTCFGDSGGPLVCNGVAQGIVSKGSLLCNEKPGVFTKISRYIPWINEILNSD